MAVRALISGFLLLLVLGATLSCDNPDRKAQLPQNGADTLHNNNQAPDVNIQVRAGADTTIQSNQLMNSLAPELTVKEVLRRLPEAKVSRREPYPNRHIQGQIDTLVTIRSDSSIFKFYSMANKDLLQSATLKKAGVPFGSGLEVGMTTDEVARHIPAFQGQASIPQSILIRAEQAPTTLRLRFRRNRVEYIQYEGYVD
jgi:hypothetical protein